MSSHEKGYDCFSHNQSLEINDASPTFSLIVLHHDPVITLLVIRKSSSEMNQICECISVQDQHVQEVY